MAEPPPLERVLIVEDEPPLRRILTDTLTRQGYRVITAKDGAQGLDKALKEKPDLLVLDVMMPEIDGFSLCRELRRLGIQAPVLFLTAKDKVEDRVHGLDVGADDYLVKPFSREELLARMRALTRRLKRVQEEIRELSWPGFQVDFESGTASRGDQPCPMTQKELAMLKLLAENAGKVVSREDFLDKVWGYAAFPSTRTVDKHILGLRQKIEPEPDHPRIIETVHGGGYRICIPS